MGKKFGWAAFFGWARGANSGSATIVHYCRTQNGSIQGCIFYDILEVHNEKLHDLLAGTLYTDEHGQALSAKHVIKETDTSTVNVWSLGSSKLEIRTNIDETIGTLRFRTRMKKVSIGKGTIHIIRSKEEVEWKCLCSVDV